MEDSCIPCGKSVVVTTIGTECVNPLIYLLEPALIASNGDLNAFNTAIQTSLENGLYLQNKNNLCCPDCVGNNSFYFLGNLISFTSFIGNYSDTINFSPVLDCCANYLGDLSSSVAIKNLLKDTFDNDISCCQNDFSETFSNYVKDNTLSSSLRDGGLVEISLFNNKSLIDLIKSKVLEIYSYADDTFLSAVLVSILSVGVFIKCYNCGILIINAAQSGTALDNFRDNE